MLKESGKSNLSKSVEVEQYKRNGYVVFKNLLDCDEVEKTVSQLRSMTGSNLSSVKGCLKNLFLNEERYFSTLRIFSKSLSVQRLLHSKEIISKLNDLGLEQLSTPTLPVLHTTSKELVSSGGYFALEPHQDWPSIVGSLNSVIVWIPLTDVGEYDHPLQVVPGSHLEGVIGGEEGANELVVNKTDEDFFTLICSPGDVVVMSTFCVHRTKPVGDGFRLACSIRYDDMAESDFSNRNYTCAYKRSVDRSLFKKHIPSKKAISKIFSVEEDR